MAGNAKSGDRAFIHRTLTVIALAGLVFLAWQLRIVLLMFFGAVVVATIFRTLADPIRRATRMPEALAVLLAVLIVAGIVGAVTWLFGAQMAAQTQGFLDRLPAAWDALGDRLQALGVDRSLLGSGPTTGNGFLAIAGRLASSLSGAFADIMVILFGGIFLAAKPRFYRGGAIKLLPPARRELVAEAMDESETALRLWLRAQLIGMVLVGAMTGIGLWLVGVPSAMVLGLIAGLFEFIPFAGPILSAIPGIALALTHSPETALWALGVYVVVQHVEAYMLYPLIQQWAVDIPAAVLLFALIAFAALFGTLGVIFAAPLTVVTYVLVKRLYVIEALDTPTAIPGQEDAA